MEHTEELLEILRQPETCWQFSMCIFTCPCLGKLNYLRDFLDFWTVVEITIVCSRFRSLRDRVMLLTFQGIIWFLILKCRGTQKSCQHHKPDHSSFLKVPSSTTTSVTSLSLWSEFQGGFRIDREKKKKRYQCSKIA